VLALVPALSFAEDEADLEQAVEELVQRLGSPSPGERAYVKSRLAAYGERIIPLLQRFGSDDPEVIRSLQVLTAPARTMRIELLPLEKQQPIGAVVELQAVLKNNTDETYALLPPESRKGTMSPFKAFTDRSDAMAVPFRFEEMRWPAFASFPEATEFGILRPGASVRVTLTIDSKSPLLRRPAVCHIAVSFRGLVRHGQDDLTADNGAWSVTELRLTSEPVEFRVFGRTPDELEKALRSKVAAQREAAVLELSLREDEAVVPLLRRHAHERALRLAAVRRLATLGADEDFHLVMEATRDEDVDVRRAAVLGLGSYRSDKARRRLGALAWDFELQHDAIRALRGHKHPATIDLFVGLLASQNCRSESVREIQEALTEWTGLTVDERVSEVERFRAWWESNREDWARKNATGR